ncbi:MAG TPA: hypothetical protein VEC11_13790 [Allosphingosinicella sp.]|nr:hypothetical protein [Allosphingosinicella sp.]
MRGLIVAAAVLGTTLAAAPAFALAEGSFHVRNETGEAQTCRVRHAGSNYAAPIVLRAGGEWSGTSRTDRPSTLICQGAARELNFRMQSGQHYALRKTGAGTLTLSSAN